jgi:hypothetical protein
MKDGMSGIEVVMWDIFPSCHPSLLLNYAAQGREVAKTMTEPTEQGGGKSLSFASGRLKSEKSPAACG